MLVTTRIEKYYKVEMTAEQAVDLITFIDAIQERHLSEIAQLATGEDVINTERLMDTVNLLKVSLQARDGDE